jgi:hypothetical protein
MSAEVIDIGRRRLKHQLARSVALLSAAGASINLDEALEPPAPDTDRDFTGRLVQGALEFMDQGKLINAAERLESAARYLRRLEAEPRERAERNRKRRERAATKRNSGGAK